MKSKLKKNNSKNKIVVEELSAEEQKIIRILKARDVKNYIPAKRRESILTIFNRLMTSKTKNEVPNDQIKKNSSIIDFEGHVPPGIRTGEWQVDNQIGSTWGYTTDMRISSAASIINKLVDIVSKNGTL